MKRMRWRKPNRFNHDWYCTYGGENSSVFSVMCQAEPVVLVKDEIGFGRCAKHAKGIRPAKPLRVVS